MLVVEVSKQLFLEMTGQADNTLIWFLSDNGGATNNGSVNLPLAGHKGIKFEGGIRVPFLMRWPERFPASDTYEPMVSALDILPTSLAAAGDFDLLVIGQQGRSHGAL